MVIKDLHQWNRVSSKKEHTHTIGDQINDQYSCGHWMKKDSAKCNSIHEIYPRHRFSEVYQYKKRWSVVNREQSTQIKYLFEYPFITTNDVVL